MGVKVIEYCSCCAFWVPIDYNINEQIDQGVRDNRRISTNETASEISISHGNKQCKNDLGDRCEYFILMESGKACRELHELG
jgi:hypothetical protein